MTECDRRGIMSRSGAAQSERDPIERSPSYFQLDERDVGDLILFARRFARHLKYYDPANVHEAGADWANWFDRDISAILATLSKLPVEPMRSAMQDIRVFLENDPSRPNGQLQAHFNAFFHLPLTLFREMAERQAVISSEERLWPVLQQLAIIDVAPALADMAAYHKGAVDERVISHDSLNPVDFRLSGLDNPGPRLTDQVAGVLFTGDEFRSMTIPDRAVASFAPGGWGQFYEAQTPNPGPYEDGSDTYAKIFDALNHNLLVSTVERVYRAMSRVRTEAAARLRQSLEDFASHTPHYALWLAFLSMFDKARAELNDFTGRHLDFYYEEILRLARRSPEPDHVHVLFELARGRDAHLVPAGTELRGGKDALGNAVTYSTDEDIVVNRARVAEKRGVRIETWEEGGKRYDAVRAAPVLASLDGAGEEDLPQDEPHFAPFGPAKARYGRMGFAICPSSALFARRGAQYLCDCYAGSRAAGR